MRPSALLAVASALVLVAACGGKDKDPTAPAANPLVGRYVLTTINGQPLPFMFRPDSFIDYDLEDTVIYTERWVRDDYELMANGRFANAYRLELNWKLASGRFPPEAELLDYIVLGRWETAGTQVRLIADSLVDVVYGDREMLTTPDTLLVPIAGPNDFTRGGTRGHESLGPNPTVFIDYTLLYKRQ